MATVFKVNEKIRALKKIEFRAEYVCRRKLDSFNLLKECLDSVDGNTDKFDEIYDEIVQMKYCLR